MFYQPGEMAQQVEALATHQAGGLSLIPASHVREEKVCDLHVCVVTCVPELAQIYILSK